MNIYVCINMSLCIHKHMCIVINEKEALNLRTEVVEEVWREVQMGELSEEKNGKWYNSASINFLKNIK